jgi:hypothetical protein
MGSDIDQDAADATAARARYRAAGPETIPPDPAVRHVLAPGERLIARRCRAFVERRHPGVDARPTGDLYVTSERLILVGRKALSIALAEIEDAAVIADRVVLLLTGGAVLAIEAERPRLLRVQIAAARAGRDRDESGLETTQRSPR